MWTLNLLSRDKHVMPGALRMSLESLGRTTFPGWWRGFALRDGELITGQQNFSGSETADAIVAALGSKAGLRC